MSDEFASTRTTTPGFVSTHNSSSTVLAGDAVFTGMGEEVVNYASVTIAVRSDQAAADNGLSMQFSSDNENWDFQIHLDTTVDSAGTTWRAIHRLAIGLRYFRVVYTNGATLQGVFRLSTMFHKINSMPLISRIDQILNTSTDVSTTRPLTTFDLDAARKHINGQRAFFFFGFNDVVGTSWEDIWATGGDITWLTTAAKVEIVSSDAADNGTTPGLGVQSVEVHGLSATGEDQDEVILTNGTSAVESALTYIRVNKMHSETCGTYGGSHQGDIICRVTGGGATLATMTGEEGNVDTAVVYGSGESGNGFWSIPLGKVLYITRLQVIPDVGSNKTIDIALYERENLLDITTPFAPRRVIWQESAVDKSIDKEFKSHIKIKALTDLWFRAKGSANSKIEVFLDFYLLDQDASGA